MLVKGDTGNGLCIIWLLERGNNLLITLRTAATFNNNNVYFSFYCRKLLIVEKIDRHEPNWKQAMNSGSPEG